MFREAFEKCLEKDEKAWNQKQVSKEIEIIPSGNGTFRTYAVNKVPQFHPNGERRGLAVIGRDITELLETQDKLQEAKEKAEESDQLKTAFLQNVSHEIRTPMNAIVGFSSFLTDPELDPVKRSHFINIIVQSSNQLLSIITDIVRIATIESGQEKVYENEVNLNALFKLINEQFTIKAQHHNLTIRCITSQVDSEAVIVTDETKLNQILSNLIRNALKFTVEGSVEFGYSIHGNSLECFVEDTGIGIPPEMHQEIFKRFRQVEVTTSRQYGGSGLGLSICKAFVEILGGKIGLTSQPGKGSRFYFSIPFKRVQKQDPGIKKSIPESGLDFKSTKTVLVAEDEDFNYRLLIELLSKIGLKILRAFNGSEAVEICKSDQLVDLVLMDIKMPVMDGYEATRRIKAMRPGLPVIAQTAYSTEEDMTKAFESGCDDFISKPFKKDQLLAKVREQLQNSA
jgi:signal transduction histidine kinase/ActR/RegA family two-component response regulator